MDGANSFQFEAERAELQAAVLVRGPVLGVCLHGHCDTASSSAWDDIVRLLALVGWWVRIGFSASPDPLALLIAPLPPLLLTARSFPACCLVLPISEPTAHCPTHPSHRT